MADFNYLKDRVKSMSMTSMLSAAQNVHERSDISTLRAFVDIARCGIKYSAGYTDYLNCAFETKSASERKNIITRGVNNGYVRRMNSRDLDSCFNDKRQFYAIYRDYISRDWLDLEKTNSVELRDFVKGDTEIVVRRPDAKANSGTYVLNLLGVDDYDDLRERLLRMGLSIAERRVIQHEEMEKLCGTSIGIIRLVTVGGSIVFACLNCEFDKFSLTAPIDEKKGVIIGSAVDSKNGMYHRHPLTGKRFCGFHIPLWNTVEALVISASKVLTSVKYCGWDVAVQPNRAELIDATSFPRHDYYRICNNEKLRSDIEKNMQNII